MRWLLARLHYDPCLSAVSAWAALLATAFDVHLRFAQFKEYLFAVRKLTRRWSPNGWLANCLDFLHIGEEALDAGFSSVLRERAERCGSETGAVRFLASASTQEALELLLNSLMTTTLEVERRHAQVKRLETSKLTHVASASRNAILRRYQARLARLRAVLATARAEGRRASRTNMSALTWRELPDAVGRPLGFLASRSSSASVGAEMGRAALAAHQAQHTERFEQLVERSRRSAKRKADVVAAIGASTQPLTFGNWITLFQERRDHLRMLMRTATRERRFLSTRLAGDSSLPPPVQRVGAEPQARRGAEQARRLLRGRTGWFAVRSDRLRLCRVAQPPRETYVMATTPFAQTGGRRLLFDQRFSSAVALCPLAEAEGVR